MGTGALPPSQDLVGQIAPPSRGLSFPTCQMMVTILHLPHRGGCEAAAPGGSRRGGLGGAPREQRVTAAEAGPAALPPSPSPPPRPRPPSERRPSSWAPRLSRSLVQFPSAVQTPPPRSSRLPTGARHQENSHKNAQGARTPQPGWGPGVGAGSRCLCCVGVLERQCFIKK